MPVRSIGAVALAALMAVACRHSDTRITTAVQGRFAADAQVKAHAIDVTTQDGVVILNGSVDSEAAKVRALELSRETRGVSRVIDNLTVKAASSVNSFDAVRTSLSDPTITAAVRSSLQADPKVRERTLEVTTIDRFVTLTGEVRSEDERDRALQLVRETPGVRNVVDRLTIRP
jgi:hyperosmotically inducible protein